MKTAAGILRWMLVMLAPAGPTDEVGSLRERFAALTWRPMQPEELASTLRSLRLFEAPWSADVRQEVLRSSAVSMPAPESLDLRTVRAALVDALFSGREARTHAQDSFDAVVGASNEVGGLVERSRYHLESAGEIALMDGGPEERAERYALLSTPAFHLVLDERNAQLNWAHAGERLQLLKLPRVVWPFPTSETESESYRTSYKWEFAPLSVPGAGLVRATRADQPGLELYLRIHGDAAFVIQGTLLLRENVLQKVSLIAWGPRETDSAELVPRSYIGFLRNQDDLILERWTMNHTTLDFRPEDIRLTLREGLTLWDLRSQEQLHLGSDPARWPRTVTDRIWRLEAPR